MKKVFLVIVSIAPSFLYSMDPNLNIRLSPRKSSGTPRQSIVTKGRRLTDTDPIGVRLDVSQSPNYTRVRSQSHESKTFVQEENVGKIFTYHDDKK